MATQLTPARIAQLINKKPQDPISADDWNDIMNLLIAQGNDLSAQIMLIQTQLAGLVSDTLNSMIAAGTLVLTNVDAGSLDGHDSTYFVSQDALTAMNQNVATTYATLVNYTNLLTNFTSLANRAQTCIKISTIQPSLQSTGDIWLEPVS